METKENGMSKAAMEIPDFPRSGLDGGAMLPLMASLLCATGGGKKRCRGHDFQQFLFTLIKPCESAEEARAVLADMRKAVESTEELIGLMIW